MRWRCYYEVSLFGMITMKRKQLVAILTLTVFTTALPLQATAQTAIIQDSTEFAKVLNYSPIPGPQIARQMCAPVTVMHESNSGDKTGGAVIGGLIGALVGSRFGGGNARNATTVAGAIGGAMVGENMASGPSTSTHQQCSTVYESGPPAGYQVTYDYKGKLLTTTTRTPPGEYLRIHNRLTIE
jgi:uncharacterized protein YcfJ